MSFKSALLAILALALVALLVIVGLAASLPDDFVIQESISINAEPEHIFPRLNKLSAWAQWTPWSKRDQSTKEHLEGPSEGVGAKLHWTSSSNGKGTIAITESIPNEVVRYDLYFADWNTKNQGELRISVEEGSTVVTWVMSGHRSFKHKFLWVLFNLESSMQSDFAEGLNNLKANIESQAKP